MPKSSTSGRWARPSMPTDGPRRPTAWPPAWSSTIATSRTALPSSTFGDATSWPPLRRRSPRRSSPSWSSGHRQHPGLDQSQTAVLDHERRTAILTQLAQAKFPVPAERVVIGPRISNGMTGFEAYYEIYPRQLSSLGSGGSVGAAATGAAGFDASGLSGSAVSGGVGR